MVLQLPEGDGDMATYRNRSHSHSLSQVSSASAQRNSQGPMPPPGRRLPGGRVTKLLTAMKSGGRRGGTFLRRKSPTPPEEPCNTRRQRRVSLAEAALDVGAIHGRTTRSKSVDGVRSPKGALPADPMPGAGSFVLLNAKRIPQVEAFRLRNLKGIAPRVAAIPTSQEYVQPAVRLPGSGTSIGTSIADMTSLPQVSKIGLSENLCEPTNSLEEYVNAKTVRKNRLERRLAARVTLHDQRAKVFNVSRIMRPATIKMEFIEVFNITPNQASKADQSHAQVERRRKKRIGRTNSSTHVSTSNISAAFGSRVETDVSIHTDEGQPSNSSRRRNTNTQSNERAGNQSQPFFRGKTKLLAGGASKSSS